MLNKLILIENGKSHQFSKEKDLVKYLMGNNYYEQTESERLEQMKLNALAKTLDTNLEILNIEKNDNEDKKIDIKNKFVIYDEKTYILSLLLAQRAILLESIDSNIFIEKLDKSKITENYIIVNTFAEELLNDYVNGWRKNGR